MEPDRVSTIISECIDKRLKRLDLGECGLTAIPEQIWEMDWLEELILGNNPAERSNYELFKTDPIVYQTLFSIPQNEQGNVVLTELKFTVNNYAPNRFDKIKVTISHRMKNLRYLNLNRCGLGFIDISASSIDILIVGGNPGLQVVRRNRLINVRVLDVFGVGPQNQDSLIEKLPFFFDPKNIEILDISFNRAVQKNNKQDQLFPYLEMFSNLKALDLTDTGIDNLALHSNLSLEYLRAEHCSIYDLDLDLLPISLRTLNVGSNRMGAIRIPTGKRFQNLRELSLDNNHVEDISFLDALPALEKLSLSKNKIRNLNEISRLTKLKHFECEDNEIINIDELLGLPSLAYLFLAGNYINELSATSIKAPLQILSLSENELSDAEIVKQLILLPTLNKLSLWGNPLPDIPKEKLGSDRYFNCLELITHHFKSLETGKVKNKEIKLILVGNSTAGKTTLRKLLQGKSYNASEDSTHGIVMESWTLDSNMLKDFSDEEELKVHIWDFGGQEYYHETHKLFFSDNAVYIVMWEDKTNIHKIIPTNVYETIDGKQKLVTKFIEHQPYDYWLKNIRHYAPTCNMLIVQNKIDVYLEAGEQKNGTALLPPLKRVRIKRLDDNLLDEYGVFQSFDLSLKKYADKDADYTFDYEKFRRQLIHVLATTVQQFKLGKSYDEVKQKLQSLQGKNYISYDEFRAICNNAGIAAAVEMASLSKYLTDTSVILYYPDHPQLSQKVFTNPVWISDTIYNILDNEVLERSGKFDRAHVEKKIGPALAGDFIDLMRNFQLIFDVKAADQQEDSFIAPQYLPESSPNRAYDIYKAICEEPKLVIRLPKFLPKTLMNALLAEFASSSIDKSYFRYGVAFSTSWMTGIPKEDNINIIECDFSSGQVLVYSKVDHPYNLRKIFEAILSIYTGFRLSTSNQADPVSPTATVLGETYRKQVPVHISVDGKNFVSWNELYERKNKLSDESMELDDTSLLIPVDGMPLAAGLFKSFYLEESELLALSTINVAALQPPKLFISYSHKDEMYKDELIEHLSGMRRTGEIKDWNDRAIVAGEKWDDVIKKNIDDADIILFLVSSSFIASDYIQNIEIKNAIERHNKNKVVIIPVPVRPCDFKSLPLRDLQAATKNFQFISTFNSRDEGWTSVIGELRMAIDKWKLQKNSAPIKN